MRRRVAKKAKKKSARSGKYAQVRIERLKVADLLDAPYNASIASQEALNGLTQSLLDFGVLTHPCVNRTVKGDVLIGGHKRRRILLDDGAEEVDCIVVEFDAAKARHANTVLNSPEIQGEFVPEMLKSVLMRLRKLAGDESKEMFARLRLDVLQRSVRRRLAEATEPSRNGQERRGKTRDDDIPNLAKTRAVSADGKLYALGDHRILCGKISQPGTLEVFGGEAADMAFSRFAQDEPFTEEYLAVSIGHLLQNTNGGVYLATHFDALASVQQGFDAMGGHWSNTLMCYKPGTKSRRDDPYRDVVVPVLYGWREGVSHLWYGGRKQSNVLRLEDSPPKTDVAVEIVVRALQNSSRPGDVVLDVSMDHGATLIAAEKTGRRFIGYCSSPRELDRIRHRWTRFVHGPRADWRRKTVEAGA
jgi:hypothetical protein